MQCHFVYRKKKLFFFASVFGVSSKEKGWCRGGEYKETSPISSTLYSYPVETSLRKINNNLVLFGSRSTTCQYQGGCVCSPCISDLSISTLPEAPIIKIKIRRYALSQKFARSVCQVVMTQERGCIQNATNEKKGGFFFL